MRLTVDKKVLRRARAIVKRNANKPLHEQEFQKPKPLPVVQFYYPSRGRGRAIERFVRVLEMTDTHLKGFQVRNEHDDQPGDHPKTYLIEKIEGRNVQLLHLATQP